MSKRLGSAYRSGRADCWLEVKNPKCARGHARGRRGLELLSHGSARSMKPRIVTFEDLVITQAIPESARRTSAGSESH